MFPNLQPVTVEQIENVLNDAGSSEVKIIDYIDSIACIKTQGSNMLLTYERAINALMNDIGIPPNILSVIIDAQGDAWVTVTDRKGYATSRVRTFAGGGHNSRTRNALMILAEAIRLDNEKPIR